MSKRVSSWSLMGSILIGMLLCLCGGCWLWNVIGGVS